MHCTVPVCFALKDVFAASYFRTAFQTDQFPNPKDDSVLPASAAEIREEVRLCINGGV